MLLLALIAPARAAGISDKTLADLGADDYATRQAATRKLLADESITAGDAADAYRKATSLEQRHRLMQIARHHFVRQKRLARLNRNFRLGALGLTHRPVTADQLPQLGKPAVRVKQTLPGFPAHAHFEVGDLILQINRRPIPSGLSADDIERHFGNVIQSLPAHDKAEFVIYRHGKLLNITLRLASRDALESFYSVPDGLQGDVLNEWRRFRNAMEESTK